MNDFAWRVFIFIENLFLDDWGHRREWVNIGIFVVIVAVIGVVIMGGVMKFSEYSCNSWATLNPHLKVEFFWRGLNGCMVEVNGTWISSSLVRDFLPDGGQ